MSLPDYYKVLNISPTATPDQIKTAYKRASLLCHPDRIPQATPGSDLKRKQATVKFQAVADAYYTLSDSGRRTAYDRLRSTSGGSGRGFTTTEEDPTSFFHFFSSRAGAPSSSSSAGYTSSSEGEAEEEEEEYGQPDPEHVFGSVFEDLLRPEVNRVMPLWWGVGAVAGAALGFIAGNLPGAAIGAFGGSKLGAVRDAKGKAVWEVFQELGANQKAEILKGLAAKVFGMSGIGQAS